MLPSRHDFLPLFHPAPSTPSTVLNFESRVLAKSLEIGLYWSKTFIRRVVVVVVAVVGVVAVVAVVAVAAAAAVVVVIGMLNETVHNTMDLSIHYSLIYHRVFPIKIAIRGCIPFLTHPYP